MKVLVYCCANQFTSIMNLFNSNDLKIVSSLDCITNKILIKESICMNGSKVSSDKPMELSPLSAWLRMYLFNGAHKKKAADIAEIVILSFSPPLFHSELVEQLAVLQLETNPCVICALPWKPHRLTEIADGFMKQSPIQIATCLRFLPAVIAAKNHLNEGVLGQLQYCDVRLRCGSLFQVDAYDWTCDSLMGGGILNRYGSQIIDLILFLTQRQILSVNATLKSFVFQTDKVHSIRHIAADSLCVFQCEWCDEKVPFGYATRVCPPRAHCNVSLHAQNSIDGGKADLEIEFFGTDGTLRIINNELIVTGTGELQTKHIIFDDIANESGDFQMYDSVFPYIFKQAWLHMLTTLHAHKEVLDLPPFQYYEGVARVIHAVEISSRKKGWIPIVK